MNRKISNKDKAMWDSVLTQYLARLMIEVSKDEDGEFLETIEDILIFFEKIRENISFTYIMNLVTVWSGLSESKQVGTAIKMVGEDDASRLLIMMDSLKMIYDKRKEK